MKKHLFVFGGLVVAGLLGWLFMSGPKAPDSASESFAPSAVSSSVSSPSMTEQHVQAASAVGAGDIDPAGLAEMMAGSAPFFLLDVREPNEYEAIHMEGATLIPMGELSQKADTLPKDKPIVVYCRSGHRSAMAAELLRGKGFDNVINLLGGMNAWTKARSCDSSRNVC